jgi:beta-lactamase class D
MKSTRPILVISFFVLIIFLTSCSVNKAKTDDSLKKFYDEKKSEGCFSLLDNASGVITVYNMNWDTTRFAPGETFEIPVSLVALHTGIVADENQQFALPSATNDSTTLADSTSLSVAFKKNESAFFRQLILNSGKDTFSMWVDSISYGNKKTSSEMNEEYWIKGPLKISPDEQLGLMKKMYFGQLPFRKSVQEKLAALMVKDDNTLYKFACKTGLSNESSGKGYAWAIGWVEENRHVYFFVNLIKAVGNEPEKESEEIARNILTHYGFFKGNR